MWLNMFLFFKVKVIDLKLWLKKCFCWGQYVDFIGHYTVLYNKNIPRFSSKFFGKEIGVGESFIFLYFISRLDLRYWIVKFPDFFFLGYFWWEFQNEKDRGGCENQGGPQGRDENLGIYLQWPYWHWFIFSLYCKTNSLNKVLEV
jgi:hypothetical protein